MHCELDYCWYLAIEYIYLIFVRVSLICDLAYYDVACPDGSVLLYWPAWLETTSVVAFYRVVWHTVLLQVQFTATDKTVNGIPYNASVGS